MAVSKPSILARLAIALGEFWRILVDPTFASTVAGAPLGAPAQARRQRAPDAKPLHSAEPDSALQLLALLQRDGRLIDFLQQDVAAYSDAEIGAAARVVHGGCRESLIKHFSMEPVRPEAEGQRITLEAGFDPRSVRLAGRVLGEPPFRGELIHRGWRVTQVRLPQVAGGHDLSVVAPAEVEL